MEQGGTTFRDDQQVYENSVSVNPGNRTTPLLGQDPSRPGPYAPYVGRPINRAPGQQGSSNIEVLSHIPTGGFIRLTNLDLEQEVSRPFVYLGVRFKPSGVDIGSVKDPRRARIIWSWRIENPDLHEGWGPDDVKYFKLNGRYYLVAGVAYQRSGADRTKPSRAPWTGGDGVSRAPGQRSEDQHRRAGVDRCVEGGGCWPSGAAAQRRSVALTTKVGSTS